MIKIEKISDIKPDLRNSSVIQSISMLQSKTPQVKNRLLKQRTQRYSKSNIHLQVEKIARNIKKMKSELHKKESILSMSNYN